MDGADSQFSFQASKDGLDMGQLYVALPQQGWILCHHIGAQQIVAVSQFRSGWVGFPVQFSSFERRPRYGSVVRSAPTAGMDSLPPYWSATDSGRLAVPIWMGRIPSSVFKLRKTASIWVSCT